MSFELSGATFGPMILGTVGLVVVIGIVETLLERRWNHSYFKNGLSIFSADIPVRIDSMERVNFELLAKSMRGRAVESIEFHSFSDNEYGFRCTLKRSMFGQKDRRRKSLRGYVRADSYAGTISVLGYSYWSYIAVILVFFAVFISADQTNYSSTLEIFSLAASVMWLVSFFTTRYRLGKVCREIAWFIEKSIAEG